MPKPERLSAAVPYMLSAVSLFPLQNTIAKYLSEAYSPLELVWARFFFYFAILLPIVLARYGRHGLTPPRPGIQIIRGGLLLSSSALAFWAIRDMSLAGATTVMYVYPFIVTALSPWLLGEWAGVRRWISVALGFFGVCIVFRPGMGTVQPEAFFALGAGCSIAAFVLLTRKLAQDGPPLITLCFSGLVGTIVSSLLVPYVWVMPSWEHWLFMAAMGLCGAVGHLLFILAYERASAALLAPFAYWEIVSTLILGYAVFGDIPDAPTWVGATIICATGIYLTIRERRDAPSLKQVSR